MAHHRAAKSERQITGYYVETYGGGRYGSIAWTKSKAEAEKEVQRILRVGAWSGMPPRVTPSY
jgi:hypothetical protein